MTTQAHEICRRPVIASFAAMVIIGLAATIQVAAEEVGQREGFSSFGPEQVIANASRLEWGPLKLEGLAPGAEIVVLRGELSKGPIGTAAPDSSAFHGTQSQPQ